MGRDRMGVTGPLEARIAAIEARQAITDLVHAYARAIRHDRCEDVPALFAPDGWFEVRMWHSADTDAASEDLE